MANQAGKSKAERQWRVTSGELRANKQRYLTHPLATKRVRHPGPRSENTIGAGETALTLRERTGAERGSRGHRPNSKRLELEEFAEAFGLRAGDRNFAGALVVHLEHVAGLEPGHHFFNVIDVDEIRAVRAPEDAGIERGHELFDGAVIGDALGVARENRDGALLDGGVDHVLGVDEDHALLRLDEQLYGLCG